MKENLAKYVLTEIENELSVNKNEKIVSNITLEHILPKKPDNTWKQYMKKGNIDYDENIHEIGNLTLLSRRSNGQL